MALTGPPHVGKASFLKEELEATVHPSDLLIASEGVDGVREAIEFARSAPLGSEQRTILVDDADSLSYPAQDALLKICEEPHSGLRIVLVAHDLHGLLPPLRSRMRDVIRWTVLSHEEMLGFADTVAAVPSDLLLNLASGRPGLYLAMMQNAGFEDLHAALLEAGSGKPAFMRDTPPLIKGLKGQGPVRDAVVHVIRSASRSAQDWRRAAQLLRLCAVLGGCPSANAEIHWMRAARALSDVT